MWGCELWKNYIVIRKKKLQRIEAGIPYLRDGRIFRDMPPMPVNVCNTMRLKMGRVLSIFQKTPDGTPGVLSRNELRNSKNMFIAGITLFTRAAIEGGVPEETAYALSDGYIQTVEECTSKYSIEKLSEKAAMRFAEEVQKHGMRNYSRTIEAAIKYIHLHLHTSITLEETAEAAGISPGYLSRLFKKETGMFLVDYIQKERIEAACNMLTYSDYTAAQISEYLCFSTQSYFIKIFKKYTGTTPAKYKKYKFQDWK